MSRYPICGELDLLRFTRASPSPIVSTARLHSILGEKVYQRCRTVFKYSRYTGPDPQQVEEFLAKNTEARKAIEKHRRKSA